MISYRYFVAIFAIIILSLTSLGNVRCQTKNDRQDVTFINSIVDGNKCNTFGYEKYVKNSSSIAAYNVTVKVVSFKAGEGSKEFQKVIQVPAGGNIYVGCSESAEFGGPSYTYTIVGEAKQ